MRSRPTLWRGSGSKFVQAGEKLDGPCTTNCRRSKTLCLDEVSARWTASRRLILHSRSGSGACYMGDLYQKKIPLRAFWARLETGRKSARQLDDTLLTADRCSDFQTQFTALLLTISHDSKILLLCRLHSLHFVPPPIAVINPCLHENLRRNAVDQCYFA